MSAPAEIGVGAALRRLQTAVSLQALFRDAAVALCESAGFERAAIFSLQGRCARARECPSHRGARARAAPARTVAARVGGAEAAPAAPGRGRVGDPRALGLLAGARSFVAAPIVCHERARRPDPRGSRQLGVSRSRSTTATRSGPSPRVSATRSSAACWPDRLRAAVRAHGRARSLDRGKRRELSAPRSHLGAQRSRRTARHGRAGHDGPRGRAHASRARGARDARGGRDRTRASRSG